MSNQGQRIMVVGPRQVRLGDFDVSAGDLGPTEAVVRTRVTLLSGGTEGAFFQGLPIPGGDPRPFPHPTGYANVGRVIAAGSRAGVGEGDVVYTMGGHASHVRVDTARQLCVGVPDLEPEIAVFARLITVPLATVRTARARMGDPAAVVGLGLVGNLAAQVLQAAGMPTRAAELLPARRELAARCGVRDVVDPTDAGVVRPDHALVLEATGTASGTLTALELARLGGEVSLVGTPWVADPSLPASDVFRAVHVRYLTLRSGWEWQLPLCDVAGQASAVHQPGSVAHSTAYAFALLRSGQVRVRELITHRTTPDRCQEVYARAVDHKDEQLGVIFDWRS